MRIAIVDDDRLICDSLSIILGAQPDIEVCGIGTDGFDAERLAREEHPDILLLDIQMPRRGGLNAAETILAADPGTRIVFLTTFSDDEYIVRALRAGVRGYLIKQDVSAIPAALRSVMAGACVLEGQVLERAFSIGVPAHGTTAAGQAETMRPAPQTAHAGDVKGVRAAVDEASGAGCACGPFSCLTDREREVAQLIAQGLDNREIARAAYMGEGTVRNHISSILSKLHLRNRTQIAIAYWRALA